MYKILNSILFTIAITIACPRNLAAQRTVFIDHSYIDTTIQPGDNFYYYVLGNFFKQANLSGSAASGGNITAESKVQKQLSLLLDNISKRSYPVGSTEQKISDFIKSAMDSTAVDKASLNPVKHLLKKIDAAKDHHELMICVAELYTEGGGKIFGFDVRPDIKNSKQNIAFFEQAGTTLPYIDKSIYTKQDSSSIKYRRIVTELATTYFIALGDNEREAQRNAGYIIDLERKLSASHRSEQELRDPVTNYNKISVADAEKLFPVIGWSQLLKSMLIITDSINIAHPPYYKALSHLLLKEPLEAWKAKIKFDYLYKNSWYLSSEFIRPRQKFLTAYRGVVFGDRNFSYLTMELLRDLVAQLYIKEYIDPAGKIKLDSIVSNIENAFAERIRKSDWMSQTTKQAALLKLSHITKNVGYPAKWNSYDDVDISQYNFFSNIRNIARHNHKLLVSKIDKPVSRDDWFSSPLQVGAGYRWGENSITIPAGMMNLPYFDLQADDAINYGGIGTVIAHEMSHGFDNLGRQYDADGNLRNWWQPQDDKMFRMKTKKMIDQYGQFIIYDSLHINSNLTLDENIADLGGVTLAYAAFKKTKGGQSKELIDGFTPDQRFFISYVLKQGAYQSLTPEFISKFKASYNSNLHAPYEIRVNGPLSNFEHFYKAFNVTRTNKMYRKKEDRIVIW